MPCHLANFIEFLDKWSQTKILSTKTLRIKMDNLMEKNLINKNRMDRKGMNRRRMITIGMHGKRMDNRQTIQEMRRKVPQIYKMALIGNGTYI